jgi:hypothetical protein
MKKVIDEMYSEEYYIETDTDGGAVLDCGCINNKQ